MSRIAADYLIEQRDELWLALHDYGRRYHHYCDDAFYSCPKAEGGCVDERVSKGECNCGADKHNEAVLKILHLESFDAP